MHILGIESSCDDTSIALVAKTADGFVVRAEKTASQIDIHAKYGGVVPEIAGRQHAEQLLPVIEEVMQGQAKPDCIAVTAGPGLITGLLMGVEVAKSLAYLWDVPLVRTNHIDGHIHSVEIQKETSASLPSLLFPALALVVSGGHTELILMKDHGVYEKIGATRDDAAGECFDKAAKLLGFPYPGGPIISRLAEDGNPAAIAFPRPMIHDETYDFSFAGLKTAALYWLRDHRLSAAHVNPLTLPAGIFGQTPEGPTVADFCASFEQAIIDVLITKTLRAAQAYHPQSVLLVGGVSANTKLRETLGRVLAQEIPGISYRRSAPGYSMDNGAMIAVAGYYQAVQKKYTPWQTLTADPQWSVVHP